MKLQTIILYCILLMFTAIAVHSQEKSSFRFPPPEFDTGYELPADDQYPARIGFLEIIDVVILVVFLIIASGLSLKKRSRKGLVFLSLLSIVYFGFYREGCVCAIGSIQNIALALADSSYTVPAAVILFFVLPLLFTAFFGRSFCAAVCPHGALQDVLALKPVKVPSWLETVLGLIPWLYLGLAVFFAATDTMFIICKYDPFIPFFRISGSLPLFIFGGGIILLGIFVARPYCRFLCPYGVLLKLISRVSRHAVSITPDECIKCGLCEDSCPFGAIKSPVQKKSISRRAKYILLLVILLIVAAGAGAGFFTGKALSGLNKDVSLAGEVKEKGVEDVDKDDLELKAFAKNTKSKEDLFESADRIKKSFAKGGLWLGVWLGLGIAFAVIGSAQRREQEDYKPDRGLCVSCARCYSFCPREHLRLKETRAAKGTSDDK